MRGLSLVLVFPLLLDVLAESLLVDPPIRFSEVAVLPEARAPEPGFQFRELFSDDLGTPTLQVHDCLRDCDMWWKLDHEMDMIGKDLAFMEKPVIYPAAFVEEVLEPLANLTLQDTFAVLGSEHQVVGQAMDTVTALPFERFFGLHNLSVA